MAESKSNNEKKQRSYTLLRCGRSKLFNPTIKGTAPDSVC